MTRAALRQGISQDGIETLLINTSHLPGQTSLLNQDVIQLTTVKFFHSFIGHLLCARHSSKISILGSATSM